MEGKVLGASFQKSNATIDQSLAPRKTKEEYHFAAPPLPVVLLDNVSKNALQTRYKNSFKNFNSTLAPTITPYKSMYCDLKFRKPKSFVLIKDLVSNSIWRAEIVSLFQHTCDGRFKTKWMKVRLLEVVSDLGNELYLLKYGNTTFFPIITRFRFSFSIHVSKRFDNDSKLFLNQWWLRKY